jgi:purine-cytosine permease-like protein
MDLLTRGAGFGYLGSTITSLIYASFTFIFFALEAAIMALALQMYLDIPIAWCYVISALLIVPMVVRGITLISRLQIGCNRRGACCCCCPIRDLLEEPAGPQHLHT